MMVPSSTATGHNTMAKRKTFSVEEFKTRVNHYLQHSRDGQVGERRGNFIALEQVLHATGNYKGFGYLNGTDMADSLYGSTLGINTLGRMADKHLSQDDRYAVRFMDTDESRRFYF